MKVVHVHRLFGDVVAEFVGGSVGDPRLYAAPREPHGKPVRMMVAAVAGKAKAAPIFLGNGESE